MLDEGSPNHADFMVANELLQTNKWPSHTAQNQSDEC